MGGGGFLLQVLEPKKLLGAVVPVAKEGRLGWVQLTYFADAEELALAEAADCVTLTIERNVALSLVVQLQVSVAQIRLLRGRAAVALSAVDVPSLVVERSSTGTIVCMWPPGLVQREQPEKDQIQLLIREDLADTLAGKMIQALAEIAIGG